MKYFSDDTEQAFPGGDTVIINERHYRLGALLHQGNTGRIYAATCTDRGADSAFVVKYYACSRGGEVWETAMREIEAAAITEKCPHIVRLRGYSVRATDGGLYEIFLLMDRLTCCTELFGHARADERRVAELCADMQNALAFLRRKGLVHGDVKPANLYYASASGWQLGDFGSVMRRGERPRFVSEGYCAPEARRGEPCDSRSDIYSLGITAYWLLSGGRLPFCEAPCRELLEEDVYAAIGRRLSGEPIPPIEGVSAAWNDTLRQMCAFDPRDRLK